jgi:hypothetical protein
MIRNPPIYECYLGGRTNAFDCLDRHLAAGRGDRVAFLALCNGISRRSRRRPGAHFAPVRDRRCHRSCFR